MIEPSALMYALSKVQESEEFAGLSAEEVHIIKETYEQFLTYYLDALMLNYQLENYPTKEEQ